MNFTDLRIGNIVLIKYDNIICEITSINKPDALIELRVRDTVYIKELNEIQPIYLNLRWLVQNNIKWISKFKTTGNNIALSVSDSFDEIILFDTISEVSFIINCDKGIMLHRLQNICHSITGIELPISVDNQSMFLKP